jgi:hypothetical protein
MFLLNQQQERIMSTFEEIALRDFEVTMTKEEFERGYMVTVNDDGSIYDKVFRERFDTLSDWVKTVIATEENLYDW